MQEDSPPASDQTNSLVACGRDPSTPTSETIAWFVECVWPALKIIAVRDLQGFADLYQAAYMLSPSEVQAWLGLIRRLHDRVAKAAGLGGPNQIGLVHFGKTFFGSRLLRWRDRQRSLRYRIFEELIQALNAEWLLPRGLLLHPSESPFLLDVPETTVWERMNLSLAGIVNRFRYPFAGGCLNVYLVRHIMPSTAAHVQPAAFYDPVGQMAAIDDNYLNEQVWGIKLLAKADAMLESYLALTRRWNPEQQRIEKRYCQWLDERYVETQTLSNAYFLRVLAEELRHGIDAIRSGHIAGDADYPRRLAETLLRPAGRLRRRFAEPAWSGDEPPLLCGERLRLRGVVSELSAQLTAAAMPDPALVIREWWHKMAQRAVYVADRRRLQRSLREHPEHALVAVLAIALLRERFEGVPLPAWQQFAEPDFAATAEYAWDLGERPSTELRLALKAIYRDEFVYAIDEPPFGEITEKGELRNRS